MNPLPKPVLVSRTSPTPDRSRTVNVATTKDLPFIVHLQRHWSENVGFMTRAALKAYILDARILIVRQNAEEAGYLAWTCTKEGLVRMIQLAVDPQLLRTHLGTKMTNHLKRAAKRGHCSLIRHRTRSNLEANYLWPDLGFTVTGVYLNPTKRSLPLIEWTLPLLSPNLFAHAFTSSNGSFRSILKSRDHPSLQQSLLSIDSSSPLPPPSSLPAD